MSGPPAFEGFILLKSFAIPICPKVMLGISGCVDRIWGRVSRFSDVNTDVNCLTRALALLVYFAAVKIQHTLTKVGLLLELGSDHNKQLQ